MKIIRSLFLLALPLYILSCGTQQRIPNYLQSYSDTTKPSTVKVPELVIQKNDILAIQVYSASTRRDVSDAPYNLPMPTGQEGGSGSGGYMVDADGNIEYPQIGSIHVEGLTKKQLADLIKKKINEKDSVLTNPSVIVRFQNLKVTVLGEVKSEGVINFPGDRLTILEAVGLAGGVTDFGMKQSVKVMREVDGKREMGVVDLSSDSLFRSPYYLLAQNDVVLIDPSKRKVKRVEQEDFFRRTGFVLSLITTMAVVIRLFQN